MQEVFIAECYVLHTSKTSIPVATSVPPITNSKLLLLLIYLNLSHQTARINNLVVILHAIKFHHLLHAINFHLLYHQLDNSQGYPHQRAQINRLVLNLL